MLKYSRETINFFCAYRGCNWLILRHCVGYQVVVKTTFDYQLGTTLHGLTRKTCSLCRYFYNIFTRILFKEYGYFQNLRQKS